jgi:hypothetical protein
MISMQHKRRAVWRWGGQSWFRGTSPTTARKSAALAGQRSEKKEGVRELRGPPATGLRFLPFFPIFSFFSPFPPFFLPHFFFFFFPLPFPLLTFPGGRWQKLAKNNRVHAKGLA